MIHLDSSTLTQDAVLNCYKRPAHNDYQLLIFQRPISSCVVIECKYTLDADGLCLYALNSDRLDKIPVKANLTCSCLEFLQLGSRSTTFYFCFQDHFPPARNRSTLMEDFYCIHVDRSMKSTNFQYKATLHVNGHTHLTHYVSNIETTNTLSDLQFCRYN